MSKDQGLDRTSFELLSHLANDARSSNKQLAAATGLAPSTTHERLKQLRKSGAYAGAHAEVDLKTLGVTVEALMHIGLAKQRRRAVALFLEKLQSLVEVRQFFVVTGRFDLIVHIAIRDTDHLKNFEYDLTTSPIIERIETAVIFETWRQYTLPKPSWLEVPEVSPRGRRRKRPSHSV
jgi:DNA-binding Lrp family transcriptional regulator